MTDNKPFEGKAARMFREAQEREEREAKQRNQQSGEEQIAKQTGGDIQHGSRGEQYVQIEEPIGVLYDANGCQLGPYRAKKYNRARVLGRGNRANNPNGNDDWDIFGT